VSITNYTELKSSLADWINRTDLTSQIPDFIMLAEHRMNGDVRIKEMEDRQTASASTSSRYLALPTRFLEMKRLQLNTSPVHILQFVPHQQIEDYYRSGPDEPDYYTIIGSEIEFDTTPDSAYTVEMSLWVQCDALSASVATNAILTNYPNIYLYASMLEAEIYMQNDARAALWEQKYIDAVEIANKKDRAGRWSAGPLIMRSGQMTP
jgi:hypothetical protein